MMDSFDFYCTLPHSPPRSVLHALAPLGLGTQDAESLTSYFARLALSHSCTTSSLAKVVVERIDPGRWQTFASLDGRSRYVWFERSVCGLGEAAIEWASVLSELTGVRGLEKLTLLPLCNVLSQKSLVSRRARWCPDCFEEDFKANKPLYFRLAWDISAVTHCGRHERPLLSNCPSCDRTGVRHASSCVLPGWCTYCGSFLGNGKLSNNICTGDSKTKGVKVANIVGELIAESSAINTPEYERADLHEGIICLNESLAGSVDAIFARRVGVAKSTVNHWRRYKPSLALETLIRLSLSCGINLSNLLKGELKFEADQPICQQKSLFPRNPEPNGNKKSVRVNWSGIRDLLEKEIKSDTCRSVSDFARCVGIDKRLLYLHLGPETKAVSARYLENIKIRARTSELVARKAIVVAASRLNDRGYPVTVKRLSELMGQDAVNSVKGLYSIISIYNQSPN